MSVHAMVSASQFDPSKLSFRDLACQYGTGIVIRVEGSGRGKSVVYRHGIQTEIGDFEIHDWMGLVQTLIHRAGEDEIQARLMIWDQENIQWLKSDLERQTYALDLHASRMFENPQWAGYDTFNEEVAHECESQHE